MYTCTETCSLKKLVMFVLVIYRCDERHPHAIRLVAICGRILVMLGRGEGSLGSRL